MERPNWDEFFMMVAIIAASRSSCLKRKVGACIVIENHIVATGYNGAPSGVTSCLELGYCYYEAKALEEAKYKKEDFELFKEYYKMYCQAVHAEENTIAQIAKLEGNANGGKLYVTNFPCPRCAKMIVQIGIKEVVLWKEYLKNNTLLFDEEKATREIFIHTGVKIQTLLSLTPERLKEIYRQLSLVGERTDYKTF